MRPQKTQWNLLPFIFWSAACLATYLIWGTWHAVLICLLIGLCVVFLGTAFL